MLWKYANVLKFSLSEKYRIFKALTTRAMHEEFNLKY